MNKLRALTVGSAALLTVGAAYAQDYTSSSSFLSAIQSNYYLDTFSGWTYGNPIGNASYGGTPEASYTAPGNGTFDWTATSGFGNLWSDPSALSTDAAQQSITFAFSGTGTTTAFGGTFLNDDVTGTSPQSGSLTLTFYDGSTQIHSMTLTNQAAGSFYGYVSSSTITSVVVTDATSNTWIGASGLYQGAAVPAPEPTTMVGLGMAGLALLRKRRTR